MNQEKNEHLTQPYTVDAKLPPEQLQLDMPLGLGISLAQDTGALSFFGRLPDQEKARVISYIQCSTTGEEAKSRVERAVEELSRGSLNFLA